MSKNMKLAILIASVVIGLVVASNPGASAKSDNAQASSAHRDKLMRDFKTEASERIRALSGVDCDDVRAGAQASADATLWSCLVVQHGSAEYCGAQATAAYIAWMSHWPQCPLIA